MDTLDAFTEEELVTVEEESLNTEERTSGKKQFSDALLLQLLGPQKPVVITKGTGRRVYGVMSDTPMSRRTKLYK